MNMIVKIWTKIRRRWMKIRLQPIRVFCLHHVCEQFDAESMYPCDWMELSEFKQKIKDLYNQGYQFISLTDAYNHLKKDYYRRKKYAVLTFDDGYKSLLEILPWLEEQNIPATLFINGKYLDGKSFRDKDTERYLTKHDLFSSSSLSSSLIEIGSHGWEHTDAARMNIEMFILNINENVSLLKKHPRYVPFHAYTWGRHNTQTDNHLHSIQIIPVFMDGLKNYCELNIIHREQL